MTKESSISSKQIDLESIYAKYRPDPENQDALGRIVDKLGPDIIELTISDTKEYPRLSREEETLLSLEIQRGLKAQQQITDTPEIDEAELAAAHLSIAQGEKALEFLIFCNQGLLYDLAKGYLRQGLQYSELIQEGRISMIRAAKKFDPTKGFRYGTLASAYIKTGLILAIRNTGRRIRLPVRVHEKLKQIHKAEIELGEGATLEEIAREANISVPWAKIYIEARNMQILEMDAPLRGDAGESTGTFHDILHVVVDDDALKNTIYGLEQEELKAFLKTTLATKFDERKTRIIEHLFALNGRKKFSAATLSRRCKVSERRINQIKNEVLDKLRELLEKEGF